METPDGYYRDRWVDWVAVDGRGWVPGVVGLVDDSAGLRWGGMAGSRWIGRSRGIGFVARDVPH